MNLKDFLKPTIGKMLLFLILMGGINYNIISETFPPDGGDILVGVPLAFYPIENGVLDSMGYQHISFSFINFAIDIIFWYIISSIAFSLYTKIVSKN